MSFHDILWTVQKKLSSFRKQEEKQNWKKNTLKIIYMYQLPPTPRIIIERLCTLQNYVFMCVLYDNRLLKIFFTWKKNNDVFLMIPCMCYFFFCQCNRLCNIHKKFFSVTKYICKVLLFGVCKTSHLIRI